MTSFGTCAGFPVTSETVGLTLSFDTQHTQNHQSDYFDVLRMNGLWRLLLYFLQSWLGIDENWGLQIVNFYGEPDLQIIKS